MSQVSLYQNNRDTQGFDPVRIEDIYEAIKNGDWEKYAGPVRKEEYGSDKQKSLKNQLPAFTMSGVFPRGSRLNESIVSHSGRIVIDIDGLKDSVEDVKDALKEDPYTESVFISVSGKGLAVVVKIDGRKHVDSFLELEKYYLNNYGLKVDQSCKNVARIRYVTSDPDIYINMDSKLFEIEQLQIDSFIPQDYVIKDTSQNITYTVADEIVKRSVSMIETAVRGEVHENLIRASNLAGGYIAGGLVDEELVKSKMLDAILSKPKNKGRKWELSQIEQGINKGKERPITELLVSEEKKNNNSVKKDIPFKFVKWYKLSKEEKSKINDAIFHVRDRHRNGAEIKNDELILIAETHKVDVNILSLIKHEIYEKEKHLFGVENLKKIEQAKRYISHKFDVKYNVVKDMIEVKQDGKYVSNKAINNIWLYLQEVGLKMTEKDIRMLLGSEWIKEYDPIKEYFDNLPEWDEKTDYIGKLCSYVGIKASEMEFFKSMLKKHLVRSVKCGLGKGENRYIIVFVDTRQNIGKTTFLRWLSPFKKDYFTESFIKSGNQAKDTNISLTQNFIYNVDELDNVMGRNKEKFKQMLSSYIINERGSHRADTKIMVRRANFFGSTNTSAFLEDDVNTRWLCFDVSKFDFNYSKELNVKDVWSQAYNLYKNGFDASLTEEEAEHQKNKNKNYDNYSVQDQIIMKYFEKSIEPMTSTDLIEKIASCMVGLNRNDITPRSLGASMSRLGYKTKRGNDGNGGKVRMYYISQKNSVKNEYTIEEDEESVDTKTKKMF